jgi:nucleoside-diphosphate-sugar epimerase
LRKCVITGVSGLIGSHLVQQMNNWLIFALSRRRQSRLNNDRFHHVAADLSDSWEVDALPESVDAVVHLAQSEYFREFPDRAEDVFQVNTVSTVRLLDYARRAGARTFVLASSGGIYGSGSEEFSEEMKVSHRRDLGFYLGTKLCSEIVAEHYAPYMNVIVLRFFFVYGPGQKKTMLIPRLVRSVFDGKPIILQGSEGIRINPTYVTDAAVAVERSLGLVGSHKINVGGPEALSLREIGETIGQTLGIKPYFEVQDDAKPRHLVGDISKMSDLLGKPEIRFRDGIRRYLKETGV